MTNEGLGEGRIWTLRSSVNITFVSQLLWKTVSRLSKSNHRIIWRQSNEPHTQSCDAQLYDTRTNDTNIASIIVRLSCDTHGYTRSGQLGTIFDWGCWQSSIVRRSWNVERYRATVLRNVTDVKSYLRGRQNESLRQRSTTLRHHYRARKFRTAFPWMSFKNIPVAELHVALLLCEVINT